MLYDSENNFLLLELSWPNSQTQNLTVLSAFHWPNITSRLSHYSCKYWCAQKVGNIFLMIMSSEMGNQCHGEKWKQKFCFQ